MIEYYLGLMWGVIIGFAVAVPVGPVGLICIQKTITQNRLSGLVPGLGAAIADGLLASVGAFSITVIFSFITKEQAILRIIGSLFLLILGIFALIKSKKQKEEEPIVKKETTLSLIDEFLSGFVLTITNPLTAFFFFLAFANITDKIGDGLQVAITFVIGIFIGSCLWWILLTSVTDRIAHRINHGHIQSMNKWFAIVLIAIGAFMSISVLF
jgi:threonine/homoserine/homoserine lactone efflux protein